jgi:hypothetical protein
MEIIAGTIILAFTAALAILWLYIRENGRAYFWGRLAARAKANHEASTLREIRDQELMAQWAIKGKHETEKQIKAQSGLNSAHHGQAGR